MATEDHRCYCEQPLQVELRLVRVVDVKAGLCARRLIQRERPEISDPSLPAIHLVNNLRRALASIPATTHPGSGHFNT